MKDLKSKHLLEEHLVSSTAQQMEESWDSQKERKSALQLVQSIVALKDSYLELPMELKKDSN